jgi:hypothetical protein
LSELALTAKAILEVTASKLYMRTSQQIPAASITFSGAAPAAL